MSLIMLEFFDKIQSDKHFDTVFNLTRHSGVVARSKKKKGGLMFMFGSRICNGVFDQYRQSKKPPGATNSEWIEPASSVELDRIASSFASSIYAEMQKQLSSWTIALEKLVSFDVGTSLARLGHSPFTTMGATLNYWATKHIDSSDFGFGTIMWFDGKYTNETCQRTVFRLCDYGISFIPQHGTFAMFKTNNVAHQTKRNVNYSPLGVAFAMKKFILTASEKRMEELNFTSNCDDLETWI